MNQDEPALPSDPDATPTSLSNDDPGLADRIRRLLRSERYAVLCTQGQGQPYGSLVAFAATEDSKALVFSTPVTTRKYRLLMECDHVALLVDNRAAHPDCMMEIEAVTATGRAVCLNAGADRDRSTRELLGRHPHLASFVASPTTALFRVDVVRYFHVFRFQEVGQWIP